MIAFKDINKDNFQAAISMEVHDNQNIEIANLAAAKRTHWTRIVTLKS